MNAIGLNYYSICVSVSVCAFEILSYLLKKNKKLFGWMIELGCVVL